MRRRKGDGGSVGRRSERGRERERDGGSMGWESERRRGREGGREGGKQNIFSAKQTIAFGSWNDENTSTKYRREI